MLTTARAHSCGILLVRAAVFFGVLVLICVPGLTRVSQRLETTSHAPSFAKNIDCPPKKVTVAPSTAVASPVPLATFDLVPMARFASVPDAPLPRSSQLFGPRPLRAPPLALLA
jgi:hypothetical protein